MLRKLIACVLAFVMVSCVFATVCTAEETNVPAAEAAELSGGPVIIVPGFFETMLDYTDAEGNRSRSYQPAIDSIRDFIPDLVKGALKAFFLFSYGDLNETAVRLADLALERLATDENGDSVYDVGTAISGAEASSYGRICADGRWDDVDLGAKLAPVLAEKIGPENVFVFAYDWRMGSDALAEQLKDFIAGVKELTSADKVNVYANSYGCQVTAQYLYLNGGADVDKAVFSSPAWTGTQLFAGLFPDSPAGIDFDLSSGLKALMGIVGMEYDFDFVTKLVPKRIVRQVVYHMLQDSARRHMMTAPSLWCLCAPEDYEEMKAKLLDADANAALIERLDAVQNGVKTHIPEILAKAQSDGMTASVIIGEGVQLISGHGANGDAITDAGHCSGGECLPVGEKFADGRSGKHVSPSGALDLTDAFLPERTWVFDKHLHGQTTLDKDCRDLIVKLLLTGEIESVDSDPAYPQFMDSHSALYDLSLRLPETGVISRDDGVTEARIHNDSDSNTMIVTAVTVRGLPFAAEYRPFTKLAPGEEMTIRLRPTNVKGCSGELSGSVKISYVEKDYIPLVKSRSFVTAVK